MAEKFGLYKDGDSEAGQRWFEHCQETNKPYVAVRYRTKLADVAWDYITFPQSWDEALIQNEEEIVARITEVFDKHSSKSSNYMVSCMAADFKNLEIEEAKAAAAELHDLITDYAPA